ncbi:MAG TPA: alpha-mannosidase [Lachnospiraceae bacterium]|jgi:alpha-mannosidase|nr:alpha-mannosidase [Lachnospiraceae bacterium]HBY72727.1 alpha-mannosidase [Lachnospiraceae bacterium]HCA69508.1 alpha-mannosidase [Lachnospiraceae bacterium]
MPYPIKEIMPELRNTLSAIEKAVYQKIQPLEITIWKTKEPVSFEERCSGERKSLAVGDSWGEIWDCAWFHFTGELPSGAAGKKVVLLIDISGEACLFDSEGCPVQGLTNVNSEFDLRLGRPGKRVAEITDCARGGEIIDLWADAGCNDLFGRYKNRGRIIDADIATCNEEMRKLSYDFEVLFDLMNNLPENSARLHSILHSLNRASLVLNEYSEEEARRAREILAVELAKKGGDASLTVRAIGHAHIDLAWLWPIRETRRKAARTFSTALMMLDKYPDYVFGASQPQLYAWVQEDYPALFEKIKRKVKEGRWEAQGAMWVEADTNISGGEALVRQILYGKRYFEREFGQEMRVLWLPDVFGYSGALPQLLKKSGVDYFMTIKLSWNIHNKFPHHTFLWSGIDGSEVLAHMPPEGTYNSAASPTSIHTAEEEYFEKGIADDCLMLFGIGDGGGGPGEEHLERLERERNLEGLIPVRQEPSIQFFDRLSLKRPYLKKWQGELYLEKHQGTYTSQARNKRYNRKLEYGLRELEFILVLAQLRKDNPYPTSELERLWKELLLYQFHDILPGSSIHRVYEESLSRYAQMEKEIGTMLQEAYRKLGVNGPCVFNTLSWKRKEWVRFGDHWIQVEAEPMGVTALDGKACPHYEKDSQFPKATENSLENGILLVSFHPDGSIKSIYDKEREREILDPEQPGNKLAVYYDNGDAWDFSIQYRQRPPMACELISSEASVDGPKGQIVQVYQFHDSRIEQKIVLTEGSRRLDFVTKVDWHESRKMLRTSFPLQVKAQEATCDIQFGSVKRPTHSNTGFDMAKYEICAHKWVDLSEPEYGVALLNDCKYGYSVKDSILDLNLLRSPQYPDEDADQGSHEFTYSLYPHAGDEVTGKVAQAAYELNIPLRIQAQETDAGAISNTAFSFIQTDSDHIVVETVKKAEDSNHIIVRLYECHGTTTAATIKLGMPPKQVALADLMEQEKLPLELCGNEVQLIFKPFEIHTLKILY